MRKPNPIIVLLYIFHIIHPQKQKRSVQPFCFWEEHSKGLGNQADVKRNICSRYYIYHVKFTSYCELIECSRPIRFFIVSLMYNNYGEMTTVTASTTTPHNSDIIGYSGYQLHAPLNDIFYVSKVIFRWTSIKCFHVLLAAVEFVMGTFWLTSTWILFSNMKKCRWGARVTDNRFKTAYIIVLHVQHGF